MLLGEGMTILGFEFVLVFVLFSSQGGGVILGFVVLGVGWRIFV